VIEQPVVLYMPAALIDTATPEPPGAACGKCALYRQDGDCDILIPPDVSPTGVCGLYVPGPPGYTDFAPQQLVPADVAGYTDDGPTMCGNCKYFLRPARCRIVKGTVEAGGCCNAWERKR